MKAYITVPLAHRFNDTEGTAAMIELVNFIDSILKDYGFSTFVIYRDFLRWGKVSYNPNTVFEKINYELKTSDLILSVHPYEGIGSNMVLGMAAARKKYIIILLDKNFDLHSLPGLMYRGFNKMTKCDIAVHDDSDSLRKNLRRSIRKFLKSRK